MSFNPYQAPTSAYDGSYTNHGNTGAGVSDKTVAALRKTRPWVVLIAVIFFISTGFMVLGGLGAMATLGFGFGLAYIAVGAIYLLPAIALIRYGNGINKLLHGGGVAELEEAVDAQASFWQIAGILTLIGIVLGILAMIAAVAIGASVANSF
ncbi:MAG TPA: hypothetical protein VK034_03480 [Enhygromyxa sp.]|nr:hypothetical protein [Enhygromyxa sp.]